MSKIEGDVTTDYLVSGGKILAESNGTDSIYYYYDSNGSIQAMKYGSTIYYYIKSAEGDILGLMNGVTGYVAATYSYDAWGVPTVTNIGNSTIGDINPIRYRGYYYDQETGLYYLGSRYYDPEIGRFISADEPAYLGANGNFVSYNLFAYCENDPINRVDDGGNFSLSILEKVVIGAVATAGAIVLTVASGGTILPVLASVALSTAMGGAIGYKMGGIEGLKNGLADGFMWGGLSALAGSTVRYVRAQIATTGTPNAMGQAGERMAGIDPTAKRPIEINGRTRIPDGLNSKQLTEVKNVKYLSNTQQLRDFAYYAKTTGRKMELFVRPTTKISKSVIEAGWKIRYLW